MTMPEGDEIWEWERARAIEEMLARPAPIVDENQGELFEDDLKIVYMVIVQSEEDRLLYGEPALDNDETSD